MQISPSVGRQVDGTVHRAGGQVILKECQRISESQGGFHPGEAVITPAGLFHVCNPIF